MPPKSPKTDATTSTAGDHFIDFGTAKSDARESDIQMVFEILKVTVWYFVNINWMTDQILRIMFNVAYNSKTYMLLFSYWFDDELQTLYVLW